MEKYDERKIMKKIILSIALVAYSVNSFAYENLECLDTNNPSLIYSVQGNAHSDKYLLSVTEGQKVVYTETLKFLDWQGEAEYRGRYSVIIYNGDEFVNFSHSGNWLKSTRLQCVAL